MNTNKDNNKKLIKRRITQACILCRKKKIKCDGTKPECLHCQEANLSCEYTEYKKRGPHKGYVRLLEERLVQLERKMTSSGIEVPPPISTTLINKAGPLLTPSANCNDFPPPDIVDHLIDLFFQYINSVFPLVHRAKLKQSIKNGTVSKPLLWGVMAIAARFSDHPNIKTDPPYWAGEQFATKALSLIDSSTLEPSIPNLQFWGIMSCLEYGRASGSKAWIYGGIAVRICHDLGLNKESVMSAPIYTSDGSIDQVEMALRRRVFWSCLCIDTFASASTNNPQGFDKSEYNVLPPTVRDAQILLDPLHGFTLDRIIIATDPLMDFVPYYLRIIERFGEICKHMSKAKTNSPSISWPPIPEFGQLHQLTEQWFLEVPEKYKFTPSNLAQYRESASQNYLNFWLCAFGMYCTGMLALHRGSLAYSDLTMEELPGTTYGHVQSSIRICKENVGIATNVFKSIREICGVNLLPYMGYSAYIFATVLMTSAFSSNRMSYLKSSASLANLYELIDMLRPYWPVCERLAVTTKDLLSAHIRLYDGAQQEQQLKGSTYTYNQNKRIDDVLPPSQEPDNIQQQQYKITNTMLPISSTENRSEFIRPSTYSSFTSSDSNNSANDNLMAAMHAQQQHLQSTLTPQQVIRNDIDFNSCEFLYDSAMFGQIIFDNTSNNTNKPNNTSNLNYDLRHSDIIH